MSVRLQVSNLSFGLRKGRLINMPILNYTNHPHSFITKTVETKKLVGSNILSGVFTPDDDSTVTISRREPPTITLPVVNSSGFLSSGLAMTGLGTQLNTQRALEVVEAQTDILRIEIIVPDDMGGKVILFSNHPESIIVSCEFSIDVKGCADARLTLSEPLPQTNPYTQNNETITSDIPANTPVQIYSTGKTKALWTGFIDLPEFTGTPKKNYKYRMSGLRRILRELDISISTIAREVRRLEGVDKATGEYLTINKDADAVEYRKY